MIVFVALSRKNRFAVLEISPSCSDESLILTTKQSETIKRALTIKPYFTKQSEHLDFSTKSGCYKVHLTKLWSWRVKQTQMDAMFENLPGSHGGGGGRFQHCSLKWGLTVFQDSLCVDECNEWKSNNLMFTAWKEKKGCSLIFPPLISELWGNALL